MSVSTEIETVFIRKLQETFGLGVNVTFSVEFEFENESLTFKVHNYAGSPGNFVMPKTLNGKELTEEEKEESLSLGTKKSVCRHILNVGGRLLNNDIDVDSEELEEEIESLMREVYLNLQDDNRYK